MTAINQPLFQPLPENSKASRARYLDLLLKGFSLVAIFGFMVGLYFALFYAGIDSTQGQVQRVFYMHVAAFSGASIGFAAAVVGGILYLRTKNAKWDTLALAGIEVGLALSLITLITGSIWARPIWNTWWTWDPRLTSAAIMVLTYAAYLLLRNGIDNLDRRRVFASVYGILAMSTVIFTFMITRIRPDTIHPTVIGPSVNNAAQGGFAMIANMSATLGVNSFVWCCLITPALMWWRIRLQSRLDTVQKMRSIYMD
ncbi:MAG: cytochrome c biogenesis protein CcsA [Anaerolineae bacterium]|jgi:heme exporter protein C|nr:cytochrome c biogenesis protein CcsA [Anaerolineae bacterium]